MKVRIIGCGAMGSAIAQALREDRKEVSLYDKHEEKAELLARAIDVSRSNSPLEGLSSGDVLLLAIKPQDFELISKEIQSFDDGLVASIITGISIEQLSQTFPKCVVLRMMPNLAVRYGDGIVALAEDSRLLAYKNRIEELFASLGMLRWISEKNFDAITALTGSGPAFIFIFIEAMVDAAIEMGFSAEMAYDLVKQMVGGTMTMLYESPEFPCELRWKVCSPAGTTIAGLRMLEKKGLRSAIIETFVATYQRAKELGQT